MHLNGLHLLLTYQCTFECDHCFVWGSPWQCGTMTLHDIRGILGQAKDVGTIEWIYFEGGEPFLYYVVMLKGVQEAVQSGFKVGIVSNAYWANDISDAIAWLEPIAGLIDDLSISSDLYHFDEKLSLQANNACAAAKKLDIPVGVISVAQPDEPSDTAKGQLPPADSSVMYRGRAAVNLIDRAVFQPWESFTECPHEDLREPGRVHLDPLGNLHICQGITIGNIYQNSLRDICEAYQPESHPITGPILTDGPKGLITQYGLPHNEKYADACHLCYEARVALRERFPEILQPDQVYGANLSA